MKASDKEKMRKLFELGNGSKEKHDFILNIVAEQLKESGEPGEVDVLALREDEVLEIYEIKSNPAAYGKGMGQLRKSFSWMRRMKKMCIRKLRKKLRMTNLKRNFGMKKVKKN